MHYENTFHLGMTESLDFQNHHSLSRRLLLSAGAGVVGALLLMSVTWDPATLTSSLLIAGGSLLFFALLVFYVLGYSITRQMQKLYDSGKRHDYEQQVTLDGYGLSVHLGKKGKRYDFDQLVKVEETTKYFFIYVKADFAYVLPKAQMAQPESDSATIREILRSFVVEKNLYLQK